MNAVQFLNTLSEELLNPEEFADIEGVSSTLNQLEDEIIFLESTRSKDELEDFFTLEHSDTLTTLLLGTSARWLREGKNRAIAKDQLLKWRDWAHGHDLSSIVTGLLLAKAQRSRGRRRRRKFLNIVEEKLSNAVSISKVNLSLKTSIRFSAGDATRKYDFIINYKNEPAVAVVSIFQTSSGGRQQEIFRSLPDLQDSLIDHGVTLLVVADGPGFRGMSGVVDEVAPSLEYLANLSALDDEYLSDLIDQAIALKEGRIARESRSFSAKSRVAELALASGRTVTPEVLGIPPERMENFILQFTATHEEFAFLTDNVHEIKSENASSIEEALDILQEAREASHIDVEKLGKLLCEHLAYEFEPIEVPQNQPMFGIRVRGAQLRLPDPLPVFILKPSDAQDISHQLDIADQILSRGSNIARIALVIDPNEPDVSRSVASSFMDENRSHLAIIDQSTLVKIFLLRRKAARQHLIDQITSQVDLTIISPFVSEGPTPQSMFFGRDFEIRRIVEQHKNQSFAIIGGRKSGKTSLLQRLRELIPQRSPVRYIDCQAHPDRTDFLSFLQNINNSKSAPVDPVDLSRAETIIRSFLSSEFRNKSGVLLLDEVDELFQADSRATNYPHVLSRALRAMSQSRTATLVATGERSLFELTRDPESPHWNFCTPIQIGPLEVDASRRLIETPLNELGIDVTPDALNLILNRSAQHPNLLQYLGNEVIHQLAPQTRSGQLFTVDIDQISALTTSPEFRHRFVVTFFSQSTALEKLISLELSYSDIKSADEIRAGLREKNIDVTAQQLQRSLDFLQLYSIAEVTVDGYKFKSEAFDFYFLPLASELMVEQWLEELR